MSSCDDAISRAEREAQEAANGVHSARVKLTLAGVSSSAPCAASIPVTPSKSAASHNASIPSRNCYEILVCNQWLRSTWANARNLVLCNLILTVRPTASRRPHLPLLPRLLRLLRLLCPPYPTMLAMLTVAVCDAAQRRATTGNGRAGDGYDILLSIQCSGGTPNQWLAFLPTLRGKATARAPATFPYRRPLSRHPLSFPQIDVSRPADASLSERWQVW
jgi:hypothetical protein